MAAQKLLIVSGGIPTQYSPAVVGGGGSANQVPALNASGLLDPTMLPSGVEIQAATFTASEALAAGAIVNVWNNSGTANARNSDQSTPSKAVTGYVLSAFASSVTATVFFGGIITGLSGLTPGTIYFLGSVGALTATPPSTAGQLSQAVGTALSATTLLFNPQTPIAL